MKFFGFPISTKNPKNFLNYLSDQNNNYSELPIKKKIKIKIRKFFKLLCIKDTRFLERKILQIKKY